MFFISREEGQAGTKPQARREAGGGKAPRAGSSGTGFAHGWAPRQGLLTVLVTCMWLQIAH